MLKRLFTLALVCVPIAGIGCASSPCSTGWGAWVGKPPSIATQTVLGPSMQTFAGQGIAAGPVTIAGTVAAESLQMPHAAPLPTPGLSTSKAFNPAGSSCTLDDVCTMLRAMQVDLGKALYSRPMPKEE